MTTVDGNHKRQTQRSDICSELSPVQRPLVGTQSTRSCGDGDEANDNLCVGVPAAATDAVTSRTVCSCDVGCPCCGHCVASWPPLPASSVAALRDIDGFIARYRVSSPPPLLSSPPAPSSPSDSTTSTLPVTTAQKESTSSSRLILPEDSREPVRDTADGVAAYSSYSNTHTQSDEQYIDQNDVFPQHPASVFCDNNISVEQSVGCPWSSQSCVSGVDSCNAGRYSVASSVAFDVSSTGIGSFSTNQSEPGFLPTVGSYPGETGGNVMDPVCTDPPRTSVMTLAQQLDAYWAQRSHQATVQHDQMFAVKAVSRPTVPPPAPPGSLTPTSANLDRSTAEFNAQLTTNTLPRAASTRSLQGPPPRPPPRSTTHDSNNTSTLFGRSLPPEPSQTADVSSTIDRIYLCQGQMSTFQGQRTLRESAGQVGLSGSVQSLPGSDITTTLTSRGRPAPQPPRRGSSMSPRLQTKSTRYGGRARSTSLRSCSDDEVDSSATLACQQSDTPMSSQPTGSVAVVRETARQAIVCGHKPVAQIRPHAIRSPSASSYTRQRIADDADSKSSVETRAVDDSADTQSFTAANTGVSLSSQRQADTVNNASVSRFGTLRSRIKDYVTAAAGVGASRRQSSSTSASFADWTMPRGRAARRSSSATSWEPDRSDYASSSVSRGTASFDDGSPWTSSSYFGVFPGRSPFSSPRSRATEVSLPQNIVASAESSLSTADVTSSITSRINTFLTFLGGSRRPAGTSPTSDTAPSTSSSSTLLLRSSSAVADNARLRSSKNVSETRVPPAKAIVDPMTSTLDRRSRAVSTSPPVRSASSSDSLAKAAVAAAAAARDARGRQPLRFVREQRTSMSTFRSSGSLNVCVGQSSSVSPHSTSTTSTAQPSTDEFQLSDGRRTSKSGTLDNSSGHVSSTKHLPTVAYQSAPSTPLDWNNGGGGVLQTMTSSLPVDSCVVRPSCGDGVVTTDEYDGLIDTDASSPSVPLSVFRQVDVEVERLIELLQNAGVVDDATSRRESGCAAADVEAARESLLALTRQFVDDSQRLVSGATRSVDALVAGVEPSLVTLNRLSGECRSTAVLLASSSQGVMLVGRVRDLAQAYRSTVSAARSAVGRPFNSVEMKSLMRQATSLAAILSSLIKMLNRTDIIC